MVLSREAGRGDKPLQGKSTDYNAAQHAPGTRRGDVLCGGRGPPTGLESHGRRH